MNLIEFIGFLISMAAMIVLLGRKNREARDRRRNPGKYREEEKSQKETLKHFLKSLDIDMEEEEDLPHPPPQPMQMEKRIEPPKPPPLPQALSKPQRLLEDEHYKFKDRIESYHPEPKIGKTNYKSPIEDHWKELKGNRIVSSDLRHEVEYHVMERPNASRARRLVAGLHSRKDMIVFQEIMNPPICLRQPPGLPAKPRGKG